MSIAVMTNVWKNSDATGNALLVLLALADASDDDGRCWPSVDNLAAKARVHRATAFRLLGELRGSGEIEVDRRPGRASVYRLTRYAVTATEEPEKPTRRRKQPVAKRDQSQPATRRNCATIEPSIQLTGSKEPVAAGNGKVAQDDIRAMVDALAEARGYPIANYPRHVRDAKALIKAGRTPDDVRRVVEHLLRERREFFVAQGNPLTMTTVSKYASVVLDRSSSGAAVRF